MKTFIEFFISLQWFGSNYIDGLETPENHEDLATTFYNQMWNLEGPRHIERALTPHDRYFSMIFMGFNEITKSIRCLQDIEVYLKRFPYAKTSVSKSRYLEYHIANYLQEVYILKNRLKIYLKRIKRTFRKSTEINKINDICNDFEGLIENGFESITSVRGIHVHKHRYTDDDLDRLQLWELLATHPKNDEEVKMLNYFYNRTYKEVRQKWIKQIQKNNDVISKLLDSYFGALYPIIFQDDVTLRFPF